jgi:protein subunit release factor B
MNFGRRFFSCERRFAVVDCAAKAATEMNFGVTQKKQQELEARMARLGLREQDMQERYVRSSGPGGQKVNKTASCVYLKHLPSGLEVKMQRERSQGLNRYYARKRLCEMLEHERLGDKSPAALKADKIRKQKQRRRRRSKQRD